jgi:signal transduction histidine kinase
LLTFLFENSLRFLDLTDEQFDISRKSSIESTIVFPSAEKTISVYLALIRRAHSEILLTIPTPNSVRRQKQIGIVEELTEAVRRGVQIRILTAEDEFINEDIELLKSRGIDIMAMGTAPSAAYFDLLIVDRSYSMTIELRHDSKNNFADAIGVSTFSTSAATVLPYVTIFQSFWQSSELLERKRAVERAKDEFINIAAHELRTPMLPLSAAASYVEQDIRRLKDLSRQHSIPELEKIVDSLESDCEILMRNTNRLLKTSEDILHVSLIETGAFNLELQEIDLDQLVESSIADTKKRYAYSKKQVDIVYSRGLSTDNSMATAINCDMHKVGLVLSSLLDNAMKFTEKGQIAVSLFLQDTYAVIKVSDCGKGIDPSIMDKLYDKFATRSEGGAGLGLYISRKIVEAHGGSLSAENNAGGGATFTVTLPTDLEPSLFHAGFD